MPVVGHHRTPMESDFRLGLGDNILHNMPNGHFGYGHANEHRAKFSAYRDIGNRNIFANKKMFSYSGGMHSCQPCGKKNKKVVDRYYRSFDQLYSLPDCYGIIQDDFAQPECNLKREGFYIKK